MSRCSVTKSPTAVLMRSGVKATSVCKAHMAHGKRMAKTRCDNVGVFSADFADGVGALGTVLAVDFEGTLACLGCDNASVVMLSGAIGWRRFAERTASCGATPTAQRSVAATGPYSHGGTSFRKTQEAK
jgi:hypothetical protein